MLTVIGRGLIGHGKVTEYEVLAVLLAEFYQCPFRAWCLVPDHGEVTMLD